MKDHHYKTTIQWTGNKGEGTSNYRAYDRNHSIIIDNKPTILGSSDPAFRGDKTRHNPEDLMVASVSGCHMLWYLHLCAEARVIVVDYVDNATGVMMEDANGGEFTQVTLNPEVTVADASMTEQAKEIHYKIHEVCFIARSVKFPIHVEPVIRVVAINSEV